MDSGQHAYAPALATYSRGGDWHEVLLSGFIGVLPDILGWIGTQFRKDQYALYNLAHSIGAGFIADAIGLASLFVYFATGTALFLFVAFGCLGYSLHLFLDSFTHVEGKRWWLWSERAFWNYSLWFALCIIALFVNPMHPWFAMIGGIWGCGVLAYCQVKYN